MTVRPLVAGNWKMNGLSAAGAEVSALAAGIPPALAARVDVVVCPPATLIARFASLGVALGGQDCHAEPSGAHTGDIAAEMLRDAGASHVILGHSERRRDHGEDDPAVAAKVRAAGRAGLTAIVCIGETEAERLEGRTLEVVGAQLAGSLPEGVDPAAIVIAYEPVWAIGTGRVPATADVAEVHGFVRARLADRFGAAGAGIRILYGGSVKPSNAVELLSVPHVNGALVGGASLKAADFLGIIRAYETVLGP